MIMKNFRFLSVIMVALTFSFFMGCSSDDDKNDDNVNVIGEHYFKIDGATYHKGKLPSGTANLISGLNVTKKVVNGGSTIVSFSSATKLSKMNISVNGTDTYFYEVPLNAIEKKSDTSKDYEYQVLLLINQDIDYEYFHVYMSFTAADGQISNVTEGDRIDIVKAGTGDLQVTLSWDQEDDLDLHIIDPDGEHIYWYNELVIRKGKFEFDFWVYMIGKYTDHDVSKFDYNNSEDRNALKDYKDEFEAIDDTSEMYIVGRQNYVIDNPDALYAFLDIDSNAACSIDGIKNENIFFAHPKNGTYTIAVNLYEKCQMNTAGAKYSVTLNYKGNPVKFSDKQTGQFTKGYVGNGYDLDKLVIIGTFEVTDAKSAVKSQNTDFSWSLKSNVKKIKKGK